VKERKSEIIIYSYTSFRFRGLRSYTVIRNNGICNDLWPSSAGYVKRSWTKKS